MVDVGDDREIADVIHQRRKGAAKHPFGGIRKREILPEIQQISTNCSGIEEVVAELGSPAQHHGHPLAVDFLEFRMGIDIDYLDVGAKFLTDWPEGGQALADARMASLWVKNR